MGYTICVDYGHGGNSGSRCGNFIEDKLIDVTGGECVRLLKSAGFNVIKTRNAGGSNIALSTRSTISNSNKANFFISIHYNAGGGEGFECIRTVRESKMTVGIANNIIKRLSQVGQKTRPRAIYTRIGTGNKDYFGVLRGTNCPAIIVEGAFLDNANDQKKIQTDEKLKGFGRIYAEAIIEYFGYSIPSVVTPPKIEKTKPVVNLNAKVGIVNVNSNSRLNVRERADTNSKVVDTLGNGDKVNLIYFMKPNWWVISYDNRKSCGIAYVCSEYLKY